MHLFFEVWVSIINFAYFSLQSLLDLHALGSTHNDPHLTKMLEDEYLEEQVESIKKIGDMITRLKRAGTSGLGEFLFDKEYK